MFDRERYIKSGIIIGPEKTQYLMYSSHGVQHKSHIYGIHVLWADTTSHRLHPKQTLKMGQEELESCLEDHQGILISRRLVFLTSNDLLRQSQSEKTALLLRSQ